MTNCRVCGAATSAFLCGGCLREVERAIGDMPSLMHEVSLVATRQTRVYRASRPAEDGEQVREWDDEQQALNPFLRSREGRIALPATSLVVNLAAADLLWAAGNTLSTWARHLAESRGAELPDPDGLIGWLLGGIDSIRWDEAAAQIHDEITALHRQMEHAVDRSPTRLYAGPCHRDDCERDLYAQPGQDVIVCDGYRGDGIGCQSTHTVDERREWLLEALDTALLPLELWREALPQMLPELVWPSRSSWSRWVSQGRLAAHARDRVGIDLYSGRDVLHLVRSEQNRIVGNLGKRQRSCA